MRTDDLRNVARHIRRQVVELSHAAQTPHLGSSLSCVEVLVAAYWSALRVDPAAPRDVNRDRFILSKGHAALAYYVTLAWRGFFSRDTLLTYNQNGGRLAEHPGPGCVPGVEAATGSLGHGLPIGLGMALAARIQRQSHRVFVLMSDGECNEGSVWEGAMFAAARRLDNVAVIVDHNRWQATGRTDDIMSPASLCSKWAAFGWSAGEVDGHDLEALMRVLAAVPDGSGKPVAIIAHTVKGRGVSFMEDDNNWHYRVPSEADVQRACEELQLR